MSPREKKIRSIQRIVEAYKIIEDALEIIPPHDNADKTLMEIQSSLGLFAARRMTELAND